MLYIAVFRLQAISQRVKDYIVHFSTNCFLIFYIIIIKWTVAIARLSWKKFLTVLFVANFRESLWIIPVDHFLHSHIVDVLHFIDKLRHETKTCAKRFTAAPMKARGRHFSCGCYESQNPDSYLILSSTGGTVEVGLAVWDDSPVEIVVSFKGKKATLLYIFKL